MSRSRDDADLVRVAKLYYEQDLSQDEISIESGLSRSNVSRMLKAARERGIVKTVVIDPELTAARNAELEDRLVEKFGLAGARVAQVSDPKTAMQRVGFVAAEWLQDNLHRIKKLGLGWGKTLESLIMHLPEQDTHKNLTLYPLIGGVSSTSYVASGDSLIQELSSRINARTRHLFAPALVASAETQQALLNEASVMNTLREASRVDVAVIGIGTFGHNLASAFIEDMKLSASERATMDAQLPVGDILGKFFNKEGVPIGPPTSQRVISINFEELERIPNVVAVAAGISKVPGVRAALKLGILDYLMVDSDLARGLLSSKNG